MTTPQTENHQPIGLDVGSSRVVAARSVDGKYKYESQLNAFLTVPYSRLAASLLERDNVFQPATLDSKPVGTVLLQTIPVN